MERLPSLPSQVGVPPSVFSRVDTKILLLYRHGCAGDSVSPPKLILAVLQVEAGRERDQQSTPHCCAEITDQPPEKRDVARLCVHRPAKEQVKRPCIVDSEMTSSDWSAHVSINGRGCYRHREDPGEWHGTANPVADGKGGHHHQVPRLNQIAGVTVMCATEY